MAEKMTRVMDIASLLDICDFFKQEDRAIITALQSVSLLPTAPGCKKRNCRRNLHLVRSPQRSFGYMFRCSKCRKDRSVRSGTFFDGTTLSTRTVFALMWLWCCKLPAGLATHISGATRNSATRTFRDLAGVCTWKMLQNVENWQFGGEGGIVQVHQRCITTRPIHKGKVIPERWVLSVYGITERRGLVTYVRDWSSESLSAVFSEHVLPGTEIWTTYREEYVDLINAGGVSPHVFTMVTSGKHFEDPVTGTHVNHAETLCNRLFAYLKQRKVLASLLLAEHIDAFMWLDQYGDTPQLAFRNLVTHIAEQYTFKSFK